MALYLGSNKIGDINIGITQAGVALQTKTATPTEAKVTVTADQGYTGLLKVEVNPISSTYIGSAINKVNSRTITPGTSSQTAISAGSYANGTITVAGDADLIASNIKKNVEIFGVTGTFEGEGSTPNLQSKTANPTESEQTISPDSGYDGLSSVKVNAISSTYVGSGVTRKSTTTITPGTTEQTAAASGVYTTGAIKVAGDTKLVASNIKSGVTIFGVEGSYTGAGVNLQSKTAIPTETEQNITPSSGYDGLSSVKVEAISSTYVGSGITRVGASTITPTKSTQTAVASGRYTTGIISVGPIPSNYITTTDATAAQGDIVNGKTAYVNGSKVTGNLVIQKYYTGSTAPSSSLGANGDLYLQV